MKCTKITICTKNREHYFGKISNGTMQLSGAGILADVFWHEIKNHAKNVELGEFVVMPNHIHGILILNGDNENNGNDGNDGNGMEWQERFHDHIIRDDAEYQRIADYIRANPLKWEDDKFYNNSE